MPEKFTLAKNERLKSRKLIEQLFNEGKKFTVTPFRIHYLYKEPADQPLQFGVGVGNKNFKKAVDRNRIKRLTREAWRLQKILLDEKLKEQNRQLNIFFIYIGTKLPDYKEVDAAVNKILDKLNTIIESVK